MAALSKVVRPDRAALVATSLAIASLVFAGAVAAEEDHLEGYSVHRLTDPPVANPYTMRNSVVVDQNGHSCTLGKPKMMLVQSQKNGGNDPRSGPAGNFICYSARCAQATNGSSVEVDTQFGTETLVPRRTRLVCLPADQHICGDNEIDPGEQCDGTNIGSCTGNQFCGTDCQCKNPCPASGGDATACNAYSLGLGCASACTLSSMSCQSACDAAHNDNCTNASENDACAAQINTDGDAQACCN